MTELDELKRNSQDYERKLIPTLYYGNPWIYLYKLSVDGLRRIESGDWLKRDGKSK